ncbi:MAG: ABC transporter permease [Tabrizicola sp.]|nr:ABC transporter permease [Tabrizicola sp.]
MDETASHRFGRLRLARSLGGPVVVGGTLLILVALLCGFVPLIDGTDPNAISPVNRFKPPSGRYLFGTDGLGRDIFARVMVGGRVSLIVGFSVAILSMIGGVFLGIITGYFRTADAVLSRVLEAFMAIPAVLLAISLIALTQPSIRNVIFAITVSEIPRVTRLMRSVVLSLRNQAFVEAAVAAGTPVPQILWRHILPNTFAPLIVQATFICGSAVILESILSFIGAGAPPTVPTWGNIIADGRNYFQLYPHMIFFPAVFLSTTVLGINILGDGLRDQLDPRMVRNI